MFESLGRLSCAFRRGTVSFSMFFYPFFIIHQFIPFFSIFVSWINTPLIHQPRTTFHSFPTPLLNQTYYSYIGAEFPKVLEKPEVEYRQVNLTVSCTFMRLRVNHYKYIHPFHQRTSQRPLIPQRDIPILTMSSTSLERLGTIALKW